MAKVNAEVKKLKTLIGYLVSGLPKVRVGVIGSKAAVKRKDGEHQGLTNAEIGFINEFGKMTGKHRIQPRSFIFMPLRLYLNDYLKKHQSTSKAEFEKAVQNGKAEGFAKKVGLVAEECIQDAFATRGFGNWEPNAAYTVALKGSDSPLIDTGELRRSISSEVKK